MTDYNQVNQDRLQAEVERLTAAAAQAVREGRTEDAVRIFALLTELLAPPPPPPPTPSSSGSSDSSDSSDDGESESSKGNKGSKGNGRSEGGESEDGESEDGEDEDSEDGESKGSEGEGKDGESEGERSNGKKKAPLDLAELPPVNPGLAVCTRPVPPHLQPYRPMSAVAKKVSAMLAAALGPRPKLRKPHRRDGLLAPDRVALHLPEPFKRHPRREGKKPRVCVLADHSGSMSDVWSLYGGSDLVDGLLDAHRRGFIDLVLINAGMVASALGSCKDEDLRNLRIFPNFNLGFSCGERDATGVVVEANVKHRNEVLGCPNKGVFESCENDREGFGKAIPYHVNLIRSCDACIVFTDGHWTDGALNRKWCLAQGIEVAGVYITQESDEQREVNANVKAFLTTFTEGQKYLEALATFGTMRERCLIADLEYEHVKRDMSQSNTDAYYRTKDEAGKAYYAASRMADKAEYDLSGALCWVDDLNKSSGWALSKMLHARLNTYYNNKSRKGATVKTALKRLASNCGMTLAQILNNLKTATQRAAGARATISYNSHRAYACSGAAEAAQAIITEVIRQQE